MSVLPKFPRISLGESMCHGMGYAEDWNPVQRRLDEIAAAIKAGANPDLFAVELDQLLETEMEPRDTSAEARWEEEYRNGPEDTE